VPPAMAAAKAATTSTTMTAPRPRGILAPQTQKARSRSNQLEEKRKNWRKRERQAAKMEKNKTWAILLWCVAGRQPNYQLPTAAHALYFGQKMDPKPKELPTNQALKKILRIYTESFSNINKAKQMVKIK